MVDMTKLVERNNRYREKDSIIKELLEADKYTLSSIAAAVGVSFAVVRRVKDAMDREKAEAK